jgi:hypothetical protein
VAGRLLGDRGSGGQERRAVIEDELGLLEFLNKRGGYLIHVEHDLGVDVGQPQTVEQHHVDV